QIRDDIRRRLHREKLMEKLVPSAQAIADAARSSSLEAAAQAQRLPVDTTGMFSRIDLVPGLGQFSEAIGAAFTVPVGQVSPPVRAPDGVAVLRVNRRIAADRAAFDAEKDQLRNSLTQQLRQQRVQEFLAAL